MWWIYALLSALFAALTAIFAKVGIKGVVPDLATAIRTVVILVVARGGRGDRHLRRLARRRPPRPPAPGASGDVDLTTVDQAPPGTGDDHEHHEH